MSGIYVASRASIPERGEMWRKFRDVLGYPVISTWIDESGEGETENLSELWTRIAREVGEADSLVLYVEAQDLPLKGALIEVGMALACGIPIYTALPHIVLEARSMRPIGSWLNHPLVTVCPNIHIAMEQANEDAH